LAASPISNFLAVAPVATFFCKKPFTYLPAPAPDTDPVEEMITLLFPVVILPLVKVSISLNVSLFDPVIVRPELLFTVTLLNAVAPVRF
jgi:hypothetical protein